MPWSRSFLQGVMLTDAVRRQLRDGAQEIANVAIPLLEAAGSKERPEVEEGIRPGGRPFARVTVPGSSEWGDGKTPRLRTLGRAAASVFPRGKVGWMP